MKKLLAILLILIALPTRSMQKEEQIVCGLVASAVVYGIYKVFNPTLEDFKREQEAKDRSSKLNIEIGKISLEYDDYKKRCLEAGKILEK
jgi:hypothetical protein